MSMRILTCLALVASAQAFAPSTGRLPTIGKNGLFNAQRPGLNLRPSALKTVSMAMSAPAISRPAPVVNGSPLPQLYVYDHCPFCVRARMIFGLKNVKHDLRWMANDDVETPTKLIGKKVAPILEIPYLNEVMNESLDIVKRIDEDPAFGPLPMIRPASGRSDIKAWQKKHQEVFRKLQRPRYVANGLLPEFAFESAREMFIKNHQMPGYEKADWKDDSKYDQNFRKAEYAKAMAESVSLVPVANAAMQELEPLIHSAEFCTEGGLSYDDIDLFARLRSITIIKGVVLPPKVRAYMDYFSVACDIPLYDGMAS